MLSEVDSTTHFRDCGIQLPGPFRRDIVVKSCLINKVMISVEDC